MGSPILRPALVEHFLKEVVWVRTMSSSSYKTNLKSLNHMIKDKKKTFLLSRCGDHWVKSATFAHLEPSQHTQHICTSRVCPSKASTYLSLPLFYSLPIKPPKIFLCTGLLTHLVYLSHRNQGWVQIIAKKIYIPDSQIFIWIGDAWLCQHFAFYNCL